MRWWSSLFMLAVALGAQVEVPKPTREVAVPLHQGRLDVRELVEALLGVYELDASGLTLPAVEVDVTGARGTLLLYGSRKLLLDTVRFRRDLGAERLHVEIDRERTRAVRRDLRERVVRLVGRLGGRDVAQREAVLTLPPAIAAAQPLAVLLHGVDSGPEVWDELRAFLAAAPRCLQVATLQFADDAAIEVTAKQCADRLRTLGKQRVVLVGHSMGGLVARAIVEDPALDPGNVRTLILLGTPNRGSDLAAMRTLLDVAEVAAAARTELAAAEIDGDHLLAVLLDRWRDGLGAAGGDLLPDSVFLQQIAARPRHAGVDYRLVLGTRAPLQRRQLDALVRAAERQFDSGAFAEVVRPRVLRWIADLDELVDGEGDGAVSVASGQLDGVEPLLVPLDHLGLVQARGLWTASDGEHPVFEQVARWVAEAGAR